MTRSAVGSSPQADPVELVKFQNVSQVFSSTPPRRIMGSGRQAPSKVVALERINLTIPAGQFVALVGASGCGKTTLLNMLSGLVRPTAGSVQIYDAAPYCPNLDIGYMFARDRLLPWRTAQLNVELPLQVRGWSRARRAERAREVLDLVGLAGREQAYPLQLSQGMRQRVALARTMATDPSLLLMDEPFAALDARTRLTMQGEFLRIWENSARDGRRKTVVFVTHDLQEATLLADRVVVMLPSPGRIADVRLVELPRPRADILGELLFTPEFQRANRELFDCLEGAVPMRGFEP